MFWNWDVINESWKWAALKSHNVIIAHCRRACIAVRIFRAFFERGMEEAKRTLMAKSRFMNMLPLLSFKTRRESNAPNVTKFSSLLLARLINSRVLIRCRRSLATFSGRAQHSGGCLPAAKDYRAT